MLDSPLKKNKHSYPLDFSSKKKELPKNPSPKYDFLLSDQQNPQNCPINKKTSVELSASSISQLFIQTSKKPQLQNHFQLLEANQALNQSQSQKQASLIYNSDFNLDQIQQPLKSIKKLNHRIVVDQEKLNNPRIQFNEDKTIATTDKTIETVTPQIPQKNQPKLQAGSIRHQNFKYFEQFQNEKQPPLLPQKPFHLVHKRAKRQSLLQRLNLHKITQKSQGSEYEAFINSQITSGSKTFRPQTYSYVNRMISNQDLKHESEQKTRRANSSFDTKKKQKIIYMNHENLGNFSFNLPNLSLSNSGIKFNKHLSEPEANLKNKFKQLPHSFLSNSKNNFFSNQNTGPGLQATQIQRLKAQINTLARSRFKNKEEQQNPPNQTDRQFTFQGEEKNQSSIKKSNSKPLPKKPTKKLEITYHVPLANLKRLCKMYLASPSTYHIAFKVPKIFMEKDLFYRGQSKQQLHENALFLFESLKINSKDMVIKRYSNCIMFICGHVVVMWHYNGKRYLGGWQYEYLDEGSKHGLGLEWQPDMYIYYGEFRNNKKHGLGALKQGPEKTTVGYWMNGKYSGTVFKEQNEAISESEQQNNPQNESDSLYEYNEQERHQYQR